MSRNGTQRTIGNIKIKAQGQKGYTAYFRSEANPSTWHRVAWFRGPTLLARWITGYSPADDHRAWLDWIEHT